LSSGLREKIKSSLAWNFANQFVNHVIFLWFGIYLARKLGPSVYGTMGLVTIFSNYATSFADMGFSSALVQRKELDEGHLSSIFWFNVVVGLALFVLFFSLAPVLASFYASPMVLEITPWVGLIFITTSLGLVQNALLDKALDFRRKVIANWIGNLGGYSVGILLAIYDYGVWALVNQLILTSLLTTGVLWFNTGWMPKFHFSYSKVRELMRFGLNSFGNNAINYWSRNADNFLIGRFLGQEALGFYSRGYSIMLLPVRNISSVISKVMFPAYSKIQDDKAEIRRLYLKTIHHIAFLTFPAMAGLTIIAHEFVDVFFGEAWLPMVPIIQWLSMLGAFQSIISLNGSIYLSLGKSHIALRVSLAVSILLLIAFVVGIYSGGLMGITIAYFLAGSILSLPIYFIAIHQIELSLTRVAKELSGVVFSVILMVSILLTIRSFLVVSKVELLIILFFTGVIVYVIPLYFSDKEFRLLLHSIKAKIRI
jgi:O-antigen/teichoic acid export membrane protein